LFVLIVVISFILEIFVGKKALVLNFKDFVVLEIVWTIIPSVILMFIGIKSINVLYRIETSNSCEPRVTLKVIAHQWYWSYEVGNKEMDCFIVPTKELEKGGFRILQTFEHLILPFDEEIRVIVSSTDVLHSWTIPSLSCKVDAVPGRLNQLIINSLVPGLFFGQCSELCGIKHRFMPIMLEMCPFNIFSNYNAI